MLSGGLGHDVLVGGDGEDRLFGWVDDDWLQGGGGADDLDGGDGIDMVNYSDSSEAVWIVLASGNGWGKGYGGSAEGDELKNIENVTGSLYDDFLSGNDEENELRGSAGNDTLKGGGGADDLFGGGGNDTASYEDFGLTAYLSRSTLTSLRAAPRRTTHSTASRTLPARYTAIPSTATTSSTR